MVNQNKGGLQGKRDLFGKTEANDIPTNLDIIQFNSTSQQWELISGVVGNAVQSSSNVGSGIGLALARVLDDLPFKSLVQNTEILLTNNPTEVLFSIGVIAQSKITGLVSALASKLETLSNVGAGGKIALAKVGTDNPLRSLLGNAEIIITENLNDLAFTIGAIAQSKITGLVSALATKIETVVNVGSGVGKVFRDKVGTTINLKSISAGAGISIVNNADDIQIVNTNPTPPVLVDTFVLGFNTDKNSNVANRYAGVLGNKADNATESLSQSSFPFAFTVKSISLFVPVNAVGAGGTDFVLRRNGVDIASTLINVATGVTGIIKVTGLTEVFAIDDLISIRWIQIGGGMGSLDDPSYMMECEK